MARVHPLFPAALLLFPGCYTTSNVVTVPPLETRYPVSASGQYVDPSGAIVTEDQYEILQPFAFARSVEGPRHDETESRLQLEPELDRIVASAQGDAVTDLYVEAIDYDRGSHGSAAGWKVMGWTFTLCGAPFLIAGAMMEEGEYYDPRPLMFTFGGIFTGIGVLSFLASAAANDPTAWKFNVKGNVVRRKARAALATPAGALPAPAPAPAGPPAATPAPAPAPPPTAPPTPAPAAPAATTVPPPAVPPPAPPPAPAAPPGVLDNRR